MQNYFLKHKKKLLTAFILLLWFAFCLPNKLFQDPYCTVIEDKDNHLLSATIATDGQWRFPEIDTVPQKFKEAFTQKFSDPTREPFYHHRSERFHNQGHD